MGHKLSFEEVQETYNAFKECIQRPPYEGYINESGLCRVKMIEGFEEMEDRDEFCILVTFYSALPENICFPSSYQGMRVFTEVTGRTILFEEDIL